MTRERLVDREHLQGMGAGKLDQAVALSLDCTLDSSGSFEKVQGAGCLPDLLQQPLGGTQAPATFQFLQVMSRHD